MEGQDLIEYNLDEMNWYYKGEGNKNLILALRNEHKVIRIRKQEESERNDKLDLEIRASLLYYERVVLPLFSGAYFQLPKLAQLNAQAKKLNEKLKDVRPKFRQHKLIKPGYVTVFEDLTLLPNHLTEKLSALGGHGKVTDPVFCVELKPKQGWLALPDRKYSKCAFCLNQFLKFSEKSISSLSEYCPLDLFSGHKFRMLNAIHSLLCSPQNNIRIFQNGTLLFGDTLLTSIDDVMIRFGNENNFCALVYSMITKNLTDHEREELTVISNNELHAHSNVPSRVRTDSIVKLNALLANSKTCDFSSQSLPHSSILDKILKIQKLDTLGADYVYNYYSSNRNFFGADNSNSPDDILMNELPKVLDPIQSYLLSTMAKDCSIMIAFQKIDNLTIMDSIPVAEDLLENKYVFNVNVADVDAKPIKCIEKHYVRDSKIVEAALDLLGGK